MYSLDGHELLALTNHYQLSQLRVNLSALSSLVGPWSAYWKWVVNKPKYKLLHVRGCAEFCVTGISVTAVAVFPRS